MGSLVLLGRLDAFLRRKDHKAVLATPPSVTLGAQGHMSLAIQIRRLWRQ